MCPAPLLQRLPPADAVTPDALLEAFLDYTAELGLELYSAQEEALLEIFAGNNVILNTPTGSGKSLVAVAMHFRALALGERSIYTAPIKALVSEKFFALCRELGPDEVGMMTGDAAVNRDAPVLCCTAEILANLALRHGERADVDHVVIDEFHYYADRDRGVAWQVPLLTLPRCTFLLMSATLGDTARFEHALDALTGRPTRLVRSAERPVPLDHQYRETPLHQTIADLLSEGRAPVYIVHFTQRAATDQAQNLMSVDFLTKDQKQEIKDALGGFRFDSPFGKELRRYVLHGVGVHHAGMLPRFRLLVEKLAQSGLLRIICGTDTLGVGVNIPIRTVLFTQLCKYDGERTRLLSVREFKQISGRAGRKGFDERGSVVAQAPEHAVENRQAEMRAAGDAKRLRKLVRKKPPERGYVHWDGQVFERLIRSEPEPLSSSFQVSHSMLIQMLERPGDGCAAMKDLLRGCHDGPTLKRRHGRTAISMFRSLLGAGVVQILPEADEEGRRVRVNADLQEDFSLNHALSLYVVETIEALDPFSETYALDVLSLVEAILEDPMAVLFKQVDLLKGELIARLKGEGVEYDERMAQLELVENPKPNAEMIYETFVAFAGRHPWVGADDIRPKSVGREMYENGATFNEYVRDLGLQRFEGVLLRYLSNVYKAMVQNVPLTAKNAAVDDLTAWLGAIVRQVDSSLLDEWERMRDPEQLVRAVPEPEGLPEQPDITTDEHAFTVLIRNALFRLVLSLARRRYDEAATLCDAGDGDEPWDGARFEAALASYWEQHGEIRSDASARSARHFVVEHGDARWRVRQTLVDPADHHDWHIEAEVDLARSREEQRPVVVLRSVAEA